MELKTAFTSENLVEFGGGARVIEEFGAQGEAGPRGWSYRRNGGSTYTLEVYGFSTGGWLLNLCERLYADRVNILSGRIRTGDDGLVCGRFELEPTRSRTTPFERALQIGTPRSAFDQTGNSVALEDYAIGSSSRFGSSIRLDIEAIDRPGFLRGFFRALEPLDLDVAEMEISTVSCRIWDRFWFSAADADYAQQLMAELSSKLDSLVDYYWS